MKVAILCGGLGTRLREQTEFRPKPMVDVGRSPILWHIMKNYAHFGHRQFVLALGYRGDVIKNYFLQYEAMSNDFTICLGAQHQITYHGGHAEQDFEVTLVETGDNTMTGGRLLRMRRYLENEDLFMLTYGDGLSDVDISRLVAFHKSHGKIATVTSTRPYSRFGVVDITDSNQVSGFREKPQIEGWANSGFFVFSRKIFDYLDGDSCILEREPLERLAAEGQLMAFRHDGFFFAMDTYREYQMLNQMWDEGRAPWKVWE